MTNLVSSKRLKKDYCTNKLSSKEMDEFKSGVLYDEEVLYLKKIFSELSFINSSDISEILFSLLNGDIPGYSDFFIKKIKNKIIYNKIQAEILSVFDEDNFSLRDVMYKCLSFRKNSEEGCLRNTIYLSSYKDINSLKNLQSSWIIYANIIKYALIEKINFYIAEPVEIHYKILYPEIHKVSFSYKSSSKRNNGSSTDKNQSQVVNHVFNTVPEFIEYYNLEDNENYDIDFLKDLNYGWEDYSIFRDSCYHYKESEINFDDDMDFDDDTDFDNDMDFDDELDTSLNYYDIELKKIYTEYNPWNQIETEASDLWDDYVPSNLSNNYSESFNVNQYSSYSDYEDYNDYADYADYDSDSLLNYDHFIISCLEALRGKYEFLDYYLDKNIDYSKKSSRNQYSNLINLIKEDWIKNNKSNNI